MPLPPVSIGTSRLLVGPDDPACAFSRAKYRKRRKVGSAAEVAERLLRCLY